MAENGRSRILVMTFWWATVVVSVPLAVAAFSQLVTGPFDGLLIQGPLVVDPTLVSRLGTVVDPGFLHWAQLAIHVIGFVLFTGLAVLIVVRSRDSLAVVAAAMLIAVATSLFAPIDRLGSEWSRLGPLIGEVAPEGVSAYWVSWAGISLLAFLRMFNPRSPKPWEIAAIAILALVGIGGFVWPGLPIHPRALASPERDFIGAGIAFVALGRAWVDGGARVGRSVRPVLLSLTLIAVTFGVLVVLRPSLPTDDFGLVLVTPRLQALYGINTLLLSTVAVFALPVSIVLAVVRYRLFEIDLLLNRALVYGTLTVIATFIFGTVTLVMSAAAGGLIGSGVTGVETSQIASVAGVVTGTALVLGLQPLRRRVQGSIDRRFYRDKFDSELALEGFAERLTTVVDRSVLEVELNELLSRTLQPSSVSLIGSTLATDELPGDVLAVWNARKPVLTSSNRVVVPLAGTEALSGAIILGPRRAGIPYRGLELEFLQRTGDRVSPALRIVELFEAQELTRRQRERVDQELGLAQRIQRELLPRSIPQPDGWRLEVFYEPAREVGGDFYDFYPIEGNRLGVVVGDVTDKGMPAALVMASCRTVLRGVALANQGLPPGEVLRRANDLLVGDIPTGMFITALYGEIDLASGRMVFANAGHNPPIWRRPEAVDLVIARGMPLGLMPDMVYEEREMTIASGDSIFLSSDGITETHGPDREMFGFARMREAADSIERILVARSEWSQGDEQEDDITLISLQRTTS